MNNIAIGIHNIIRWFILIIGILAVIRAWIGWRGGHDWIPADKIIGLWFTMFLDIQLILGLVLYFFISQITTQALSNFLEAIKSAPLRFFTLEHLLYMVVATLLAHLGRGLAKRQVTPSGKHKFTAIFFTLSMILILLGMPWMRPLFPNF